MLLIIIKARYISLVIATIPLLFLGLDLIYKLSIKRNWIIITLIFIQMVFIFSALNLIIIAYLFPILAASLYGIIAFCFHKVNKKERKIQINSTLLKYSFIALCVVYGIRLILQEILTYSVYYICFGEISEFLIYLSIFVGITNPINRKGKGTGTAEEIEPLNQKDVHAIPMIFAGIKAKKAMKQISSQTNQYPDQQLNQSLQLGLDQKKKKFFILSISFWLIILTLIFQIITIPSGMNIWIKILIGIISFFTAFIAIKCIDICIQREIHIKWLLISAGIVVGIFALSVCILDLTNTVNFDKYL